MCMFIIYIRIRYDVHIEKEIYIRTINKMRANPRSLSLTQTQQKWSRESNIYSDSLAFVLFFVLLIRSKKQYTRALSLSRLNLFFSSSSFLVLIDD